MDVAELHFKIEKEDFPIIFLLDKPNEESYIKFAKKVLNKDIYNCINVGGLIL
jgi:hypothetical protein